jgi:general nucleoside transport system permease protein
MTVADPVAPAGPTPAARAKALAVRGLIGLIAPVAAIVLALVIAAIVLRASGYNPTSVYNAMLNYGTCLKVPADFGPSTGCQAQQAIGLMVQYALPLFLSGIAVAIGFQMNLFNIGVDGQQYIAALFAATVGAQLGGWPAPIALLVVLLVAMGSGAAWAGIAGLFKTTRGVSEVISTIMLNYVAYGVADYLFTRHFTVTGGGNNQHTHELPASAQFFNFFSSSPNPIDGMVIVAAVIGVAYWFVLGRTRYGYDLRASGLNPFAAAAAGVPAKRMVLSTMLLSGAIAGLVGLPYILNQQHFFDSTLPSGAAGPAFFGIAVALLGRNSPVGITIGALLFGFLDSSAAVLDLNQIPKEIVAIMQGIIVLSVVVAYETVRRVRVAQAERAVSRRIAEDRRVEATA